MSWEVEGHYYHNWSDYQAALSQASQRRAATEAESLRRQLQRQSDQIRETESRLIASQGNYQQQLELNARLGRQVGDLQRTQQQMINAQSRIEAEMSEGFSEVSRHFARTESEVDRLKQDQQQLVKDVRNQFSNVRTEVEEGLKEAHTRVQQSEARLRTSLSQLDAKFEQDRSARLRQAKDDLSGATILCQVVNDLLGPCIAQAEHLDLQAETHGIHEQLESAKRQIEQGHSTAALAAAEAAYAGVRKVVYLKAERGARLTDAKRRIDESVDACRKALDSDIVIAYFGEERAAAVIAADSLERRSQSRYSRYDRLPVRAEEDERLLLRLEEEVQLVVQAAPEVQQMFLEREDRIEQILDALQSVCGDLTQSPVRRFASPQDPKSRCIIECHFTSGTLDVYVPLDLTGSFTIEAHGHDTNKSCDLQFQRVMNILNSHSVLATYKQDGQVRSEPQMRVEQLPVNSSWVGVPRRLEQLREELR